MRRRSITDLLWLTIATCAALALWLALGVDRAGVLGSPVTDLPAYFWPVRQWLGQALATGYLPWWAPQVYGGTPFLANPQVAGFYPPNWLFAALPVAWAFNGLTLFHLALPAIATGWLARTRGASRPAAALAAVIVATSGPAVARVYGGHVTLLAAGAWFPLLLLLLSAVLRRPTGRPLAGLSLVLAMSLLAGHPQMVFYGLVLGVLWTLGLTLESAALSRELGRRLLPAAVAVGLALVLAAIQLIPSAAFVSEASRSNLSMADRGSYSLPWFHLLGFVYPGRYAEGSPYYYWGAWYAWEMTVFVGYPALVLAGLGLMRINRLRSPGAAPLTMAIGALVIGLGSTTPLFEILGRLPGFSSFRGPARVLYYLPVAVALFAATGLDALIRWITPIPSNRQRLMAYAIGACGVLMAAVLFLAGGVQPSEVPALLQHLPGTAQPGQQALQSSDANMVQAVTLAASNAAVSAALFAILSTLAIAAVIIVPRRRRSLALIGVIAVQALHTADALRWTAVTARHQSPNLSGAPPLSSSRMYFVGEHITPNALHGTSYGSANGYDPLFPRVQGELINAVNGLPRDAFAGNAPLGDPLKVAAVLGVTHVWENDQTISLPPGLSGPRVTLHRSVQWAESQEKAWEILAQRWKALPARTPDLGPPVVVATASPVPPNDSPAAGASTTTLTLISSPDQSGKVTVRLDPPGSGVLILRDTRMDGWSAYARTTTNGSAEALVIQSADIAHQAVVLKTPAAEVEFRYQPPGQFLGAACSLFAAVMIIIFATINPTLIRTRKNTLFTSSAPRTN